MHFIFLVALKPNGDVLLKNKGHDCLESVDVVHFVNTQHALVEVSHLGLPMSGQVLSVSTSVTHSFPGLNLESLSS